MVKHARWARRAPALPAGLTGKVPEWPTVSSAGSAAGEVPAHIVSQDADHVAFLDARPVFKGHVLVVPRQSLRDAGRPAAGRCRPAVRAGPPAVSAAIPAALGAQGTFVALNNVVSQSVPHLHVHVVPRTKGDGLRGFFWPRQRYASEEEAAEYARRIAEALAAAAA